MVICLRLRLKGQEITINEFPEAYNQQADLDNKQDIEYANRKYNEQLVELEKVHIENSERNIKNYSWILVVALLGGGCYMHFCI